MFDSSDLAKKFDKGEAVRISFHYINLEIENDLNSLLIKILSRFDLQYLYETFESVLREMLQNAMKANMKRIWFSEMGLDINNEEDYRKGIANFKEVAYNPESMTEKLFASQYRISIDFEKRDSMFTIEVVNNAPIVPAEMKRLQFRLERALECRNFAQAYENTYDATEGAGLGIILIIMLLRNAGLGSNSLRFIPEKDSMRVALAIPAELKSHEMVSTVKNRILEDVKTLPTFPENIVKIQALCNNPETSIDEISDMISLDPSLAADVLRLSNSAGFITGKRVTRINEAIMIIGLKNLNWLLVTAASRKILDKRYRRFEQVWEHSNRTACYARYIALEKGRGRMADTAFIAGLLHDIGKIVLLATDMDLVDRISEIVKNRKIRTTAIIEEIAIGISHSAIGALIAEKWNFPEELIEAIRYHHSPLAPEIHNRDLVMIIYLANQMRRMETKEINLLFLESEVLMEFNIANRHQFEKFLKRIRNRYVKHEQFLKKLMP